MVFWDGIAARGGSHRYVLRSNALIMMGDPFKVVL
jgi:hypothetical protein